MTRWFNLRTTGHLTRYELECREYDCEQVSLGLENCWSAEDSFEFTLKYWVITPPEKFRNYYTGIPVHREPSPPGTCDQCAEPPKWCKCMSGFIRQPSGP